jgi:hypothetical protein
MHRARVLYSDRSDSFSVFMSLTEEPSTFLPICNPSSEAAKTGLPDMRALYSSCPFSAMSTLADTLPSGLFNSTGAAPDTLASIATATETFPDNLLILISSCFLVLRSARLA